MSANNNQEQFERKQPSSVADLTFNGAIQLTAVLATALAPHFAPLLALAGSSGSTVFLAWQSDNLKKLFSEVQQNIETIDEAKVDGDFLETDEFKELIVQIVETASRTASELKRKLLARALVNSTILPTSKFSGKSALIRVLAQMSDEEMVLLEVLKKSDFSPRLIRILDQIPGLTATQLADRMEQDGGVRWSVHDVLVTCQGLRQLGCAVNADIDGEHWVLTELADKLIDLVLGGTTA